MKRGYAWLMFCALAGAFPVLANAAISTRDAAPPLPVTLTDSAQWDMHATANGRVYRVFVSLPAKPAPASGYGVLYVMDANAMFLTAVETVRSYERRPDLGADVPPTVVVGIGYPPGTDIPIARTLDLTPVPTEDKRVRAPGGGAGAFLDFIQNDVKPAVEKLARIDRTRQTLFGHSFGGLFTLHTLATRPDSFQTYVAASPSLWYAGGVVKKELTAFAAKRTATATPLRVLLTAGQYEGSPAPWSGRRSGSDVSATLKAMNQLGNGREMANLLNQAPGITAGFDEIAEEDHGSVVPAAISRGVRFMETSTATSPVAVPAVPSAQAYLDMTAEQRYRLRLQVRGLPDAQRIPWLTRLKKTLHDGLTKEQGEALHAERNRMDREYGTQPHAVNAK